MQSATIACTSPGLVHKVEAIKALRTLTGMGLKEAKELVEEVTYTSPNPKSILIITEADFLDADQGNSTWDYKNAFSALAQVGFTLTADPLPQVELTTKLSECVKIAMEAKKFNAARAIIDVIELLD